jgi:hypothetical protein
VWSHLRRSICNLTVHGVDQLLTITRHRLKSIQYRPDLIDGFLAHTGLSLGPCLGKSALEGGLADPGDLGASRVDSPRRHAAPERSVAWAATRVTLVCGQKIALGRTHAGQTVTVAVSDTTLAIELRRRRNPGCARHHHHTCA